MILSICFQWTNYGPSGHHLILSSGTPFQVDIFLYRIFSCRPLKYILIFLVDETSGQQEGLIKDQKVWTPAECAQAMVTSTKILHQRTKVVRFLLILLILFLRNLM